MSEYIFLFRPKNGFRKIGELINKMETLYNNTEDTDQDQKSCIELLQEGGTLEKDLGELQKYMGPQDTRFLMTHGDIYFESFDLLIRLQAIGQKLFKKFFRGA